MTVTEYFLVCLRDDQTAAAGVLTETRKVDHITPWLPVHQRVNYRILLLVYKAYKPSDKASRVFRNSFTFRLQSLRSCFQHKYGTNFQITAGLSELFFF